MIRSSSSLWRFAAMLLGIVLCALLLAWALTSWTLSRTFDQAGRAVIADDLGEYSVLYEQGGGEGVRALFTAGEHDHDQLLRLVSKDGRVLLDVLTPHHPAARWPDVASVSHDVKHGEVRWHQSPMSDGTLLTYGRQGLHDGAELWFGRTDAGDIAAIQRVRLLILITMMLTALLAVAPIAWFAIKVLRPVRTLIGTAHHLAEDSALSQRLPTTQSIPELGEFADAFNATLDRVQHLTEELEAANDQLAHELRTPLARIRGNVEHCLVRMGDADLKDHAARAVEEIDRASNLVQTILAIRAGDARSMKLQLDMISLVELSTSTCELYEGSAEAKQQKLELTATGEEKPVLADSQRLQQALCNLLDNAIAYTPNGGRIEVEVIFNGTHAEVQVRDTGPGLSDSDPARMWRRFMRGSAASANTPGIGLGLSLVKAVVVAHRGEVTAANRPGGGAVFSMRLPV